MISIHALREESDSLRSPQYRQRAQFQSTPSARRATLCFCQRAGHVRISIHALREESDAASAMTPLHTGHFNPRSPWGERREQEIIIRAALEFQSTLSVGRATKGAQHTVIGLVLFQSTPSARRATVGSMYSPSARLISIHALREEGDPAWATPSTSRANFNPRPPRGGRPPGVFRGPLWGAISIHALREEGDWSLHLPCRAPPGFQSTPSARRATAKAAKKSTTFVPLYTLVHNLKRNFTKAPAK